jgi:hypothetical protein
MVEISLVTVLVVALVVVALREVLEVLFDQVITEPIVDLVDLIYYQQMDQQAQMEPLAELVKVVALTVVYQFHGYVQLLRPQQFQELQ